jgi:hypothetical protein
VRRSRTVPVDGAADAAWGALAGPAWSGPIGFVAAGDAAYAGTLRLIDADEDRRAVGGHAQARRTTGWGGVTASFAARPAPGGVALDAEIALSGDARADDGEALLDAVAARLEAAVRAGAVPAPAAAAGSPADDPAWRRRLAARAVLAIGIGAAAGLVGARLGRRR